MRTIVAGCRFISHAVLVDIAIDLSGFDVTEVVSGTNGKRDRAGEVIQGVDLFGEAWAEKRGIPILRFPPNWDLHGRAAGPIRNREMAKAAEALVALWDGKSRGTGNMIEEARKAGLEVYVYRIDGDRMLYLTEEAASKARTLMDLNGIDPNLGGVRLGLKSGGCSGLTYELDLVDGPEDNDRSFGSQGLTIFVNPKAYLYLKGTTIDYADQTVGGGFSFDNPNARRSCGCGTSFSPS